MYEALRRKCITPHVFEQPIGPKGDTQQVGTSISNRDFSISLTSMQGNPAVAFEKKDSC